MAWSWSHTQEAYSNAEQNLRKRETEWLHEAYAEWRALKPDAEDADHEGFSQFSYAEVIQMLKDDPMSNEELADRIWDRASEQQTCDNGGFNAWMCPYGCHTVTFDSPVESLEERDAE